MMPVSIIVPTYRVGKDLLDLVLSVQKQFLEGDELIVVDNDSSRYAPDLLKLEGVHYHKYPENRGPCPARNFGAGISRNEWLLFLDDDGLAHDGMLEALRNIIRENPGFYAIRGKIIPRNDYLYNHLQSHYDMGEKPMPYFLNLEGNVAIRKREFDAVGGWNETLYGHEGEELSYRLIDRFGAENCQYHPGLVLYHDFSDSLLKHLKKDSRHSSNYRKLQGEYPHLKPLVDSYKKMRTGKQETIDTLPYTMQKKIRLVLRLTGICRRHPVFRRTLLSVLQGLNTLGIRI